MVAPPLRIVDMRWQAAPCEIVRITSTSSVVLSSSPRARRSVTVELDVAPKLRTGCQLRPVNCRPAKPGSGPAA